ncbi:MAG: hypothetical protein ACYTXC_05660, partial [Nostoc sp.]
VEMVMLPSQLLKDFSLMILTNFLPLWNETALGVRGDQQVPKITANYFSNILLALYKFTISS